MVHGVTKQQEGIIKQFRNYRDLLPECRETNLVY